MTGELVPVPLEELRQVLGLLERTHQALEEAIAGASELAAEPDDAARRFALYRSKVRAGEGLAGEEEEEP